MEGLQLTEGQLYNFNGIHPVVLLHIKIDADITIKHDKFLIISSINAICFDP